MLGGGGVHFEASEIAVPVSVNRPGWSVEKDVFPQSWGVLLSPLSRSSYSR